MQKECRQKKSWSVGTNKKSERKRFSSYVGWQKETNERKKKEGKKQRKKTYIR